MVHIWPISETLAQNASMICPLQSNVSSKIMTLGNCASATTRYEYEDQPPVREPKTMQHEATSLSYHSEVALQIVFSASTTEHRCNLLRTVSCQSRARKKLHTQAHCTETRGTQPQNGKALCSLVVEYFYSSSSCCFLVSASVLPTIPPITQCCQHGRPRHHTLLQSTALSGFRKRCTMCQERAMSKASTSLTYMPRPVPRS